MSLEDYIAGELIDDAPDRAVEDQQDIERLRAIVRRMPEERQQLLNLKFVDGMSNAEIGDIMQRTEGAVKSLYHRTLMALREELQQADSHPEPRRKKS